MAAVTTSNDGKDQMADDRDDQREEPQEREERARPQAAPPGGTIGGGFFHLYKPGQGYWTRLGTFVASGLLLLSICQFVYTQLAVHTNLDVVIKPPGVAQTFWESFPKWKLAIVSALFVGGAVVVWYVLNRPTVVDFLIATESEMKKVNWTTRKELVGSTKVVILFMFLIASLLFVFDILFGYFFFLIKVLHHAPF